MADLVTALQLSANTIRNMVADGRFPQPQYPTEGSPRWTANQVETWLKALEMGLIPKGKTVPKVPKKPVP
jgi:predicted DNA-binding transcriptional regulator AlpA